MREGPAVACGVAPSGGALSPRCSLPSVIRAPGYHDSMTKKREPPATPSGSGHVELSEGRKGVYVIPVMQMSPEQAPPMGGAPPPPPTPQPPGPPPAGGS